MPEGDFELNKGMPRAYGTQYCMNSVFIIGLNCVYICFNEKSTTIIGLLINIIIFLVIINNNDDSVNVT